MTRAEIDWHYQTVCVKDQVLGNVFRGTFSDSFWQNLSPHPHCQDILQSTSCQILDFLPSCWGCLLTPRLEICVSHDKFGFLGIIDKLNFLQNLPTQFWMILSPNKQWHKIFFPLLSKTLWSRINCYYSIQFSILKQKRTQHYY